jgi:hypothetical protein
MRIQTALLERSARLLSLCFRSEFHVLVPCCLRGAQGTCCPRLTSTTGRSLQKHSQDPGFQNSARAAGPLLNSHPASFTRPPRSVLQSTTLEPLGQGVGGEDFLAFRSPGTSCNAFNLLDFRRVVKGGFFRIPSPCPDPPPFPATALQDTSLSNPRQPLPTSAGWRSRPWRGRDGSPAWAGLPRTRNPRECFSRGFL